MNKNFITLLCSCALALGFSSQANASIVDTAVVDNPLDFSVTWDWNKAGDEADIVIPPTNWLAPISVSLSGGTWTVESKFSPGITGVQHLVNPHAGETSPGFTPISLSFLDTNLSTFTAMTSIGHGSDWDHYTLTVTNIGPLGNTITLEGAHVPVPAAVWLFGSGLLGLMRFGSFKKRV